MSHSLVDRQKVFFWGGGLEHAAFFSRVDDGVDRFNRNVGTYQPNYMGIHIIAVRTSAINIKIFTVYNFTLILINVKIYKTVVINKLFPYFITVLFKIKYCF